MTTATLPKRPVTKETVTETPEKLYPNRAKLTQLLAEHAAITAGVEEFENRLNRAELDLNFAIENDSDEDIERHQSAVSVFNLKVSAKRATLGKLVAGQLPQAISAASNEFSTLLLDERNRRTTALSERIAKVLGADPERLVSGHYLDDLLEESAAVKEIDQLRFNSNLVGASDEVVLSTAKHLLDCYAEILRASKEEI